MGIRVNNNSGSLQAQRQLGINGQKVKRSFNRLSSGLRINSAADDAAGLAISERFGSQLRGLNQAIRNANDGVSLTQTAEAGLSGVSDGLQRIRELSIQAANGTLTKSDRQFIQAEIDQISEQIGDISQRTTFNGRSLLSGGQGVSIQAGASANEVVEIPLADVRPNQLGAAPQVTGAATEAGGLSAGELSIDGVNIRASQAVDDTVSTADASSSAIAVAAAINDATSATGVSAQANETEVTGAAIGGGALDSNNQLIINEVAISGINVAQADASDDLVDAINAQSEQTGVTASLDANGALALTAQDGRNIEIETTGNAQAVTGLSDGVTRGTVTLTGERSFEIAGTDPSQSGLQAGQVGPSADTTISRIDVTTQAGANRAIETVDRAIESVSSQRAQFGASQNRLESTISNLSSARVNIADSNSRIRDADFAKEASDLMLAQIKEKASIAMLAQSNKLSRNSAITLLGQV